MKKLKKVKYLTQTTELVNEEAEIQNHLYMALRPRFNPYTMPSPTAYDLNF